MNIFEQHTQAETIKKWLEQYALYTALPRYRDYSWNTWTGEQHAIWKKFLSDVS